MSHQKELLVDFVIRHLWHKFSRMYNQRANEHGMTISIGFILLNVDKEGTPSTQLGPKMGMESTSLSRLLNTMEERGYIERRPNPEDGRGVLIFLTQQGKEKRALSKNTVLEFNNGLLDSVEPEKMEHFFEVIEAIKKQVEKKQLIEY